MSSDARRKEKQRLKRKEKQRQARRVNSVTPLQRIARDGGQLECYVNVNWRETGMASVQVLGHAPGGRTAYAAFLVDVWCVGLKDAFGRQEMGPAEFRDVLDRWGEQYDVARIDPAEAKRLVAAGVRFARQNGFRLPPHADRWTAIFGPLDVGAADLDGFGVEGRLRYVGTKEFLRQRLVGSTIDEFLARPDVEWVLGDGTPRDPAEGDYNPWAGVLDDDDDDDDFDDEFPLAGMSDEQLEFVGQAVEGLKQSGDLMEGQVRAWCAASGRTPHPLLREGINALLVAAMPGASYHRALEEDPASVEGEAEPDPNEYLDELLETDPEQRPLIQAAIDQVSEYLRDATARRGAC